MKRLIRLKSLVSIAFFLLIPTVIFSQNIPRDYNVIDNLHPVSPTAFQFVKYTELPVSEYTGLPNVSIPLYEIKEDGVKIPLNLTYHGGGIRVNEDASWVGLGWDLQVGSIVQQVNDHDDLLALTQVRPDYINTGTPYQYPFKYQYCNPAGGTTICNYGCSGLLPVDTATYLDGLVIYTNQYAPYNGNYSLNGDQQNFNHFFSDHNYYSVDSEPDIFTASFLGQSFKFVWDWNTRNFMVLNKRGYKVIFTGPGGYFKVFVPSGEEFDFALESVVQSISNSQDVSGSSSSSPLQPSSNVWLLTQIITKNKKVITFNYNAPSSVSFCYPTFSQRGILATLTVNYSSSNTADWLAACQMGDVGGGTPTNQTLNSNSYPQEYYYYLKSINFPNGTVSFNTSARNDILGGSKLDNFSVSTGQTVKSYTFNYSYFDATAVGGNRFTFSGGTNFGNCPMYRLKLLSIQDNSAATHTFTYNTTPLPAKNSFAVDYWGFYNGRLTNTTAVPNGSQFVNAALHIDFSAYGNNYDNHSANSTYATAGMLQQIQYPTGGKVNFNYELNQFNNYWVPDYANSNNTVSSGDGVRIQSVTFTDASNNQLKKTTYAYSGGQAILPVNFFRTYNFTVTSTGNPLPGTGSIGYKSFELNESTMSGFFSSDPFASINGVGYSQVTKTDVDINNLANGKIVSNYNNTPDQVYNAAGIVNQIDPILPAYKDHTVPENGTVQSEYYYDQSNNMLKQISNSYINVNSPLYYGARLYGYGSLVTYTIDFEQVARPQNMVGYYPIYDFETLLSSSTETDYFGTESVSVTTTNNYDTYSQLSSSTKTNSANNEYTQLTYPYNYSGNTVLTAMVVQNRLSDIVTYTKSAGTTTAGFTLNRSYQQTGTLIVPSTDVLNNTHAAVNIPTTTSYDLYDASNGNILQYTKNTLTNSFIYDYNNEYVIAEVKNAPYTSVAYTSFEADGKGRWTFTGTTLPDNTAITGKKDYSLTNGNISCTGLSTTQTYIVSYWSKNGAQTVSGSSSSITGYSYNGWTYYENSISNPASGTITVSGTGTIDELRLYPNNAQMTSYTYEPLVGITSTSDAGAKISYYEYDGSMRLLDIRDQSKNIVKAFCYNYAGQPTNCGVNIIYSNAFQSVPFTKTCSSGYTGSTVAYTVVAGKYTSTMSQADANNQALAEAAANGQSYANANGTCTINVPFTLSNTTTTVYHVTFSPLSTHPTYDFINPGTTTIYVPAGMYTVSVYPESGLVPQTITLGARTPPPPAPQATFLNVNIGGTGSTDTSISIQ